VEFGWKEEAGFFNNETNWLTMLRLKIKREREGAIQNFEKKVKGNREYLKRKRKSCFVVRGRNFPGVLKRRRWRVTTLLFYRESHKKRVKSHFWWRMVNYNQQRLITHKCRLCVFLFAMRCCSWRDGKEKDHSEPCHGLTHWQPTKNKKGEIGFMWSLVVKQLPSYV